MCRGRQVRDGGAYGCAVPTAYANLNPGLALSRPRYDIRLLPIWVISEWHQKWHPTKLPSSHFVRENLQVLHTIQSSHNIYVIPIFHFIIITIIISNLMGPKDPSVCQVTASRTSALEVLYIRNDSNMLYKFTFTQLLRPTYWVTSPNVDEIL